jgi:hypothetical protein
MQNGCPRSEQPLGPLLAFDPDSLLAVGFRAFEHPRASFCVHVLDSVSKIRYLRIGDASVIRV